LNWLEEMRNSGDYDCILGLSGGVDSSYLAHLAVNVWGLNCLAVTFDNGWNTDIANENIRIIVDKLGLDHIVGHCDEDELNAIHRTFVMSRLPDVDIASDLALLRCTFDKMYEYNIKYYLSGANPNTEIPQPIKWSLIDDTYMMDVLGGAPISLPRLTPEFYLKHVQDHKEFRPFRFIEVPPDDVIKDFLEKEYGWQKYGGKHCENIYTRWTIYDHLYRLHGIKKWENYIGYGREFVDDLNMVLDRLHIDEKEYFELIKLGGKLDRSGYKNNFDFWKKNRKKLQGKVPDSFWRKYC